MRAVRHFLLEVRNKYIYGYILFTKLLSVQSFMSNVLDGKELLAS